MHPAFSVLFFTVTSGFGYGFLFCLLLAKMVGWVNLPNETFFISVAVAIGLITLGLMSSTFHLANPKNAWRSFVRVRTSWLSREGVLAVLGYPLFAATLYLIWSEATASVITILSIICLGWIAAIVYCTAMIYASLKTIPQWYTPWVPTAFLIIALTSGLLCLGQATAWSSSGLVKATPLLLFASLLIKLAYYRFIGQPTRSSINTATSFSQAQVTLFDSGHSSKNFLQREFIYEVGPKTMTLARWVSLLLAFVMPAALITLSPGSLTGWLVLLGAYIGLILERWLFFVEAKHVVRHYYGG